MSGFVPPALPLPPRRGRGLEALTWDRVLIMGVVNTTPDSFSDGGLYLEVEAAVAHGIALWQAGADVLDIGGEATNPRARSIDAARELDRVIPVIEQLAATTDAVLSIDTTKATVAAAAVRVGADIINDVAGGRFDPAMFPTAARTGAAYVCGHLRGTSLADVFVGETEVGWREVVDEQRAQLDAMPAELRARSLVDPGLGFGKGDDRANAALIAHSRDIAAALGAAVLVGPSRKRFLGRLHAEDARQLAGAPRRLEGSARPSASTTHPLDAATVGAALAAARAGAHMVRTHDVSLLRPALAVYTEIGRSRSPDVD